MSKKTNAVVPEPRPLTVVCSICDENWDDHAEVDGEVSTLECVRLLKERAQRAEAYRPAPFVVRPYPYYPYQGPYWTGGVTMQSTYTSAQAINCSTRTPSTVASAVAA